MVGEYDQDYSETVSSSTPTTPDKLFSSYRPVPTYSQVIQAACEKLGITSTQVIWILSGYEWKHAVGEIDPKEFTGVKTFGAKAYFLGNLPL